MSYQFQTGRKKTEGSPLQEEIQGEGIYSKECCILFNSSFVTPTQKWIINHMRQCPKGEELADGIG
ncbi:MAG TPA: hypothetical protein VG097_10020, partial [Gemmata sp.]|nr:hypothetical protein [Gemmata sp.]